MNVHIMFEHITVTCLKYLAAVFIQVLIIAYSCSLTVLI